MKSIFLSVLMVGAVSFSFAQDKAPAKNSKEVDLNQERIQMHEGMMKAHQQAAECLKSGKTNEECRSSFQEMCQSAGGSSKCGPWMMDRRGKWNKEKED